MELSGTIVQNLRRAIDSAHRHRGKPVYQETVQFWTELVSYARHAQIRSENKSPGMDTLIGKLCDLISGRLSA